MNTANNAANFNGQTPVIDPDARREIPDLRATHGVEDLTAPQLLGQPVDRTSRRARASWRRSPPAASRRH
jgi:hypothetical protein